MDDNGNGHVSLDDLAQRAAENRMARLAALLEAIEISAIAEAMGRDPNLPPECKAAKGTIAGCLGYSTRTVTQLAAMHDLPEDCIDVEAKPGMYWAAIQNSDTPVEVIRHALDEGWTTPGKVKEYLGVQEERHPPLLVSEVDVVEVEPGQMVIRADSIKPEDGWPGRVRARLSEARNGR